MIKLKVSLSGTDEMGKPFSVGPGECISLDKKSEANYIKNGMAEQAKQKTEVKKKK